MNARLAIAIALTIGAVAALVVAWALRTDVAPRPSSVASIRSSGTNEVARSGPATPEPSAAPAPPANPASSVGLLRPAPRFDVVRVEPDGSAVIAGRAEPGASVTLRVDGKPVADVEADSSGQFVLIPPPLASGERALSLSSRLKGGDEMQSAQAVTVLGAAQDKRLVALAEPGAPTRILGQPTTAPDAQTGIRTVEAEQGGAFYASGHAPAGSNVRLYLNGGLVAQTIAAQDGAWSVRIAKGMKAGAYVVRADQVGAAGKVASRAEVTFNYPAQAEAPAPQQTAAQQAAAQPRAPQPAAPPAAPAVTRRLSAPPISARRSC